MVLLLFSYLPLMTRSSGLSLQRLFSEDNFKERISITFFFMCPLALLSFLILSDILVSLKLVSCLAVVMEEYMEASWVHFRDM